MRFRLRRPFQRPPLRRQKRPGIRQQQTPAAPPERLTRRALVADDSKSPLPRSVMCSISAALEAGLSLSTNTVTGFFFPLLLTSRPEGAAESAVPAPGAL